MVREDWKPNQPICSWIYCLPVSCFVLNHRAADRWRLGVSGFQLGVTNGRGLMRPAAELCVLEQMGDSWWVSEEKRNEHVRLCFPTARWSSS